MMAALTDVAAIDEMSQVGREEPDDEDEFECFGRFRTVIVGIQYYTGAVNNNEMVQIIREPHNQHDRFAIRVDNVRGQRVGHLKREVVCHIAPLVDEKQLRLEGVVPSGSNNRFTMPLVVYCYGPPSQEENIIKRLRYANLQLEQVERDVTVTGGVPDQLHMARITQQEMEANLDRLFHDLMQHKGPKEYMEPSPDILSPLYLHQKQALAWMYRRETGGELPPFWEPRKPRTATGPPLTYVNTLTNFCSDTRPSPLRGGILADDMGLGKTLEVIALMATNRTGVPTPHITVEVTEDPLPPPPPPKRRKTTKAPAPGLLPDPALLPPPIQPCAPGQPSHAPPGQPSTSQIIATYLHPPPAKKLSKAQAKLAELAASESPPLEVPILGGPKATLIVCPLSVMSNWVTQIEEHTSGALQVYQFHGQERSRDPAYLAAHDVVLTTYGTLAQELGRSDGIMGVRWLRVVLDEAHNIKNTQTQQTKAACTLQSTYRWAVTGTPVQNKLGDLHALLSFLRIEPLSERTLFNRTIERPIKAQDVRGLMRLQILMGALALRRTKDLMINGRPIVELPSKSVHITTVALTPDDRLKYDRWEMEGRRIISNHITASTLMANYSSVLEIILRLRQICCSGGLCPAETPGAELEGSTAPSTAPPTPELLQRLLSVVQAGGEECPICLNDLQLPCITRCGHAYCRRCIEAVMVMDKPACPLCRTPIAMTDLFDVPQEELSGGSGGPGALMPGEGGGRQRSAKVTMLMASLMAAASQGIKAVVFSQFTGMLNLVEAALREEGLPYVRLDGSTPSRQRGEMVKAFASMQLGSPMVFLASLKAGGVGMNLTAASHVHLLDPWWNPAVEEQAMDRVHRLGQIQPVEIFRYVAENSIEERMLQLQERKRELSRAAFDRKNADQQRQMRLDDIKLLMEL